MAREPQNSFVVSVVEEADDYSRSVAGVHIEAVRNGAGDRPSRVKAFKGPSVVVSDIKAGFPMLARGHVSEDRIIAVAVVHAPEGANWCGIDLEDGMVVLYGPGAAHTGVNPTGTTFRFSSVPVRDVMALADDLGLDLSMPPHGEVHAMPPSGASRAMRQALAGFVSVAGERDLTVTDEETLVGRIAATLTQPSRSDRIGGGRKIDDRKVVGRCLDYAEAMGRVPTVREMCLANGVSERRLRIAFANVFAMPPSAAMRAWGLDRARRRLLEAKPWGPETVTEVALDLGFRHLGRFAVRYKAQFGESPSTTRNGSASPAGASLG